MARNFDGNRNEYDFDPNPTTGPIGPTLSEPGVHLHPATFDYLRPTEGQLQLMQRLRDAARRYSELLETFLPDGPDKTFILRQHRQNAMWVNVAVTRFADGTPRP